MKTFAPLPNQGLLSEKVEEQIEQAIREKELLPGTRLPSELEFCRQFGISRTVIREALRVLHSRGLITIFKGKGMFVSEFSSQSASDPLHFYLQMNFERSYVMDIVHARQILEPNIVELAAINKTMNDLERIANDIELLRSCPHDFQELAKIDTMFHVDIARASGNSLMPLLLEPLHRLIPDIKSSVYATVSDARDSALLWHQKIFDEINRGNAKGARAAMIEHLSIAEKHATIMINSVTIKNKEHAPTVIS